MMKMKKKDRRYHGGGEVDLEDIADDIRATMAAQEIQDAIDSQGKLEAEDAIFSKKVKTYAPGGSVSSSKSSKAKGCGAARPQRVPKTY